MSKRLTQDEFLQKVYKDNENDIDYSNFVYNGNSKKGVGKCNVCGYVWEALPMSLFKGHGCPKCAIKKRSKKITKDVLDVIDGFRNVHGDKYDYSKVKYVNNKTLVEILCPIHGSFFQKPNVHLNGHGCPKCANSGVKLTQEEFEMRAREKNPNLDISKFKYVNSHEKSICKCNICGHEWKTSHMLLRDSGYSCPNCSKTKRTKDRTYTLNGFLTVYRSKFKDSDYDFSKSHYTNSLAKMIVTCPKHGDFEIRPNDLLSGHGCPICNNSRLEIEVASFLDKEGIEYIQYATFDWLINQNTNRKLTFDFYIPKYNIAIECQGDQHFVPIEHFGGIEKFEDNKYRDSLKRKLAKENGIRLLYYQDKKYNGLIDDGIEEINQVTEILKEMSNN